MTKEEGRIKLQTLIDNFEYEFVNQPATVRRDYNEATVRAKFLDPFFEALGWDMRGKEAHVEYSQTREDDGSKGRADYFFTLGHGKEFYVEAKKPAENLAENPHHFMQARRYAYSAKHPVTVLTDFEEFFVYLGRGAEPKPTDNQNTARITSLCCTYTDYLNKWDELWQYFSRDNVMQGALETIPGVGKDIKGSAAVDSLFLADIESWRKLLAENIHKNNPSLSRRLLNELVQRTIDRIIFLRICEDREIEEYGRILKLKDVTGIYDGLKRLFKQADDRYNSGLFHFKKEKGRQDFDETSLGLVIDDEPLQTIVTRLYWPGGPYAFAAMPADILGQVYERFLGKVIEIDGDTVTVEDKPEVKKAGGVFYTPEYIVDYIVKHTVGRLLDGSKPAAVAKLRILDPACGSGAFLINAYQYLLDWHLDWYKANTPEKWSGKDKPLMKDEQGIYRLTLAERKRILLANIYGVDIDSQAVEVTRLSLLLKCLEGETRRDLQMQLFTERLLPDLDANIKCGNSLIGRDFYHDKQPGLFGLEEKLKINVFDWISEFAAIMTDGGFDAVIGNPPYVRQETLGDVFKNYVSTRFSSFAGTADLYVYFIEKAHTLLKTGGLFGYICSNKFMRSNYGSALRAFLATHSTIRQLIDFGELPVFQTAATFPVILLTEHKKPGKQSFTYAPVKRLDFETLDQEVEAIGQKLDESALAGNNWTLASSGEIAVFEKMRNGATTLGAYIGNKIYYGIKTGLNEAFVIDRETRDRLITEDSKNAEFIKPFAIGDYVRKYRIEGKEKFIILIPRGWTKKQISSISEDDVWFWFQENYASLADHLRPFQEKAVKRCDKGDYWWELRACDYYDAFTKPKIMYPVIGKELRFTLDSLGYYSNDKTFIIPVEDFYLLGLLNSSICWSYLKRLCSVLGDADKGGRLELRAVHVKQLPIRTINFDDPAEKKLHDDLVTLVKSMLKHHKDFQTAGLDSQSKKIMQDEITDTDRQINAIVYKLYDLTPEEIKIVEGAS